MFGDASDKNFVKMGSGWFIPNAAYFSRKSMGFKLAEERLNY